jgi:hypothetical protein
MMSTAVCAPNIAGKLEAFDQWARSNKVDPAPMKLLLEGTTPISSKEADNRTRCPRLKTCPPGVTDLEDNNNPVPDFM